MVWFLFLDWFQIYLRCFWGLLRVAGFYSCLILAGLGLSYRMFLNVYS